MKRPTSLVDLRPWCDHLPELWAFVKVQYRWRVIRARWRAHRHVGWRLRGQPHRIANGRTFLHIAEQTLTDEHQLVAMYMSVLLC